MIEIFYVKTGVIKWKLKSNFIR